MHARIDVHDWEKVEPQPVVINLELDLDGLKACLSDRLEDTVNYADVIERLRIVAVQPDALAEAMAHSMCDCVLENERVLHVRLVLIKLAPYPGAQVGLVLERERGINRQQIGGTREHQRL